MNPFLAVLVAFCFLRTCLSTSSDGTKEVVRATTVVDKTTRGAETVRALLRNESGRAIVVVAKDVTYIEALAPSDPRYNTTPPDLNPSRAFHMLGVPCLFEVNGYQSVTVTSPDGKVISVWAPPTNTPEPVFPTAPFEIVSGGTMKLVGPIEHFDDFHCGGQVEHDYRVYSVIRWSYQDEAGDASDMHVTTSPTISVSFQ
jgi:hypothetical protein